MEVWTHIHIEGHCIFSSMSKKIIKSIEFKGLNEKTGKIEYGKESTRENKQYIPRKERPEWCRKQNKKRVPGFGCLCSDEENRCPFFVYSEAEDEDNIIFNNAWHKYHDKKEEN